VMLVFNNEEAQTSVRGAADILEPELPVIKAIEAAIIDSVDASTTADQIPQAASDAAVQ
jgi:hypothetical protein